MEQISSPANDPDWSVLRPVIDEALSELGERDRDVIFLRYFEQRSLRDLAGRIGVAEDAARMRLNRATERLREILVGKGLTTTVAALTASLAAHAAPAVAPALSMAVLGGLLSGPGTVLGTTSATAGLVTTFTMNKATVIVGAVLILGVTLPIAIQHRMNGEIRDEARRLRGLVEELQRQRAGDEILLRELQAESDRARRGWGEVVAWQAEWRRERDARNGAAAAVSAAVAPRTAEPKETEGEASVSVDEVARFLALPASEQGKALGASRFPPRDGKPSDARSFVKSRELANRVRVDLEGLEDRPADFASFQAAYIESVAQVGDVERVERIRGVIQSTQETALAEGLNATARPATDVDAWATRRDALDRKATREVQAMLTEDERRRFDEAFLGVMGIDLGMGDGAWHRFIQPDGAIAFPSEQTTGRPESEVPRSP